MVEKCHHCHRSLRECYIMPCMDRELIIARSDGNHDYKDPDTIPCETCGENDGTEASRGFMICGGCLAAQVWPDGRVA